MRASFMVHLANETLFNWHHPKFVFDKREPAKLAPVKSTKVMFLFVRLRLAKERPGRSTLTEVGWVEMDSL